MRKRFLALMVSTCLAASLCACGSGGDTTETTTEEAAATEEDAATESDAELVGMKAEIADYLSQTDESFAYDIAETLAYDDKYLSNELGFRTAGSDAEHAAADYLQGVMEDIGLEEIEQVPVTVDKWQFNDASLTIEGTDIDIMPASYMTNGTSEEGITAELVDVGTGTEAEYEGLDVEGKIVIAGVDQWNEAWIDQYMNEASVHGAAAIITYDVGGYATYSDDMINMQDVCDGDIMPCVSISKNQYNEIREALDAGNNQATLMVDSVMEEDAGTSYNVVGRIKGRDSSQQIIISGHYDVYFNGFQDDSTAIGLILAIAKAMKDSDYVPQNDIVFVCHGAEEWGATNTQFDWTTGAWEMINTAHPEWAESTIAMLNFEIPAFYDGMDQAQISCVPEFASVVEKFVSDPELCPEPVNDIYPGGVDVVSVDTNTMEDGVSYRAAGVPYFIDIPGSQDGENGWIQQRYHTSADDKDTYNADVMATNINMYGALAIYVDKTPALELDLTATCDDLEESLDLETATGTDADAYTEAIASLRESVDTYNEEIAAVNEEYETAVASGASDEELDAIYEEGKALNQTTLEAFKYVQDNLVAIILSSDIVFKHSAYQDNIQCISAVIDALKAGNMADEEETGALNIAYAINGGSEYGYYSFSTEGTQMTLNTLLEDLNPGNLFWGTDKGFTFAETREATQSLLSKAEAYENGEDVSFDDEIAIYESALEAQETLYEEAITAETAAMEELAEMLK